VLEAEEVFESVDAEEIVDSSSCIKCNSSDEETVLAAGGAAGEAAGELGTDEVPEEDIVEVTEGVVLVIREERIAAKKRLIVLQQEVRRR
jgi:hypothetical protein